MLPQVGWYRQQYNTRFDLSRYTKIIEAAFPGLDEQQFLFFPDNLQSRAYAVTAHDIAWKVESADWVQSVEYSVEIATALLAEAKLAAGPNHSTTIASKNIVEADAILAHQRVAIHRIYKSNAVPSLSDY